MVLGLWSTASVKKSICSLQRNRLASGPWSLLCCIWEEVDLFLAKEQIRKWSLVFGLLHLGISRFVLCKGTYLDLVLGLWSAASGKKSICSLQRNRLASGPWSLVCCIWEEVDLFFAKKQIRKLSLVFGLLHLGISRFDLWKGVA
jgi:hypothetical protein